MGRYVNATIKTKTKIRETFWSLYQKKAIEKISVREITEIAQYNRSTFYEYYSDIYAILEEIEEALLEDIFGKNTQLVLENALSFDELIYDIANKYKKNKKYLTVLLGKQGDPQFINKLKINLKDELRPHILDNKKIAKMNQDYFLEYITNGLIGMLMYWQQNDSGKSIEQFLIICKEIIIPSYL